jgi:hypothetical protein
MLLNLNAQNPESSSLLPSSANHEQSSPRRWHAASVVCGAQSLKFLHMVLGVSSYLQPENKEKSLLGYSCPCIRAAHQSQHVFRRLCARRNARCVVRHRATALGAKCKAFTAVGAMGERRGHVATHLQALRGGSYRLSVAASQRASSSLCLPQRTK